MTLLLADARLLERRLAAAGALAPLADSLAADLAPLVGREPYVPTEKAQLSRAGGRCPREGASLEFDPFSPHSHRCPSCGDVLRGAAHDRMWVMSYQLWLAERAVHAAALHLLRGGEAHAALAEAILELYAERYLAYPNRDNALGPTRVFFSTYLESIWLLQLCAAVDLLEAAGRGGRVADAARARIVAPSRALIGSYDEGASNRQVWNNAALLAAALLLDDRSGAEDAVLGGSGLAAHLSTALLPDGSWYEGENYHLFAHRGLWYGVSMAECAGIPIPDHLIRRFEEGFATPFVTALPDFTFPARRDSQYAVSLRQWRFAELCELGLARRDDVRLRGALGELYSPTVPRGDTGRARSTAETERNLPASGLTRADLGWRSLLHAREALPELGAYAPASALLEAQGLAIFRRDAGRVYVAVDYGHPGGGHGHPDRLNLLLADGATRWLDDTGTGSYVDRTLHWYRSTLAHNAPVVNGESQRRVGGRLRAHEERGAAGWVDAEVIGAAPGVRLRRQVVVMPDYVVDRLTWEADDAAQIDLPIHVGGELSGVAEWRAGRPAGGDGLEDGFDFLDAAAVAEPTGRLVRLDARRGEARAEAWVVGGSDAQWWRAAAPGAPGAGPEEFFFVRRRAARGEITSVWSWRGGVSDVWRAADCLGVLLADGSRQEHRPVNGGWQVILYAGGARSSIDLEGVRPPEPERHGGVARPVFPRPRRIFALQRRGAVSSGASELLVFHLGGDHYRRSEQSWREAGAPTATVSVGVVGEDLAVHVDVVKRDLVFAPARAEPVLDNENPDINSDGVQLYLRVMPEGGLLGWLVVPEDDVGRVRISPIGSYDPAVRPGVRWRRTANGYAVSFEIPLTALGDSSREFGLDVVINEISRERVRRRGQLVMSGGGEEYVYLRGDRHSAERLLGFRIADA